MDNELLKEEFFDEIRARVEAMGFNVVSSDYSRPWGGFLVIDESQSAQFKNQFFSMQTSAKAKEREGGGDEEKGVEGKEMMRKESPKILMILPNRRLSWQYHHRRAELWTVVSGPVGVVLSDDDLQKPITVHENGDFIEIQVEQRHRLVGLDRSAVVAEIWQHSDPKHPSDECDIVRLADDFNRN